MKIIKKIYCFLFIYFALLSPAVFADTLKLNTLLVKKICEGDISTELYTSKVSGKICSIELDEALLEDINFDQEIESLSIKAKHKIIIKGLTSLDNILHLEAPEILLKENSHIEAKGLFIQGKEALLEGELSSANIFIQQEQLQISPTAFLFSENNMILEGQNKMSISGTLISKKQILLKAKHLLLEPESKIRSLVFFVQAEKLKSFADILSPYLVYIEADTVFLKEKSLVRSDFVTFSSNTFEQDKLSSIEYSKGLIIRGTYSLDNAGRIDQSNQSVLTNIKFEKNRYPWFDINNEQEILNLPHLKNSLSARFGTYIESKGLVNNRGSIYSNSPPLIYSKTITQSGIIEQKLQKDVTTLFQASQMEISNLIKAHSNILFLIEDLFVGKEGKVKSFDGDIHIKANRSSILGELKANKIIGEFEGKCSLKGSLEAKCLVISGELETVKDSFIRCKKAHFTGNTRLEGIIEAQELKHKGPNFVLASSGQISSTNMESFSENLTLLGKIDNKELLKLIATQIILEGKVQSKNAQLSDLVIKRQGNLILDEQGILYGSLSNEGNFKTRKGLILGPVFKTGIDSHTEAESLIFAKGKEFDLDGEILVGSLSLNAEENGRIRANAIINGNRVDIETDQFQLFGQINSGDSININAHNSKFQPNSSLSTKDLEIKGGSLLMAESSHIQSSNIHTDLVDMTLLGSIDNKQLLSLIASNLVIEGKLQSHEGEFNNLLIKRQGNLILDNKGTVYGNFSNEGTFRTSSGLILGNIFKTGRNSHTESKVLEFKQGENFDLDGELVVGYLTLKASNKGSIQANAKIKGETVALEVDTLDFKGEIDSSKLIQLIAKNITLFEDSFIHTETLEINGSTKLKGEVKATDAIFGKDLDIYLNGRLVLSRDGTVLGSLTNEGHFKTQTGRVLGEVFTQKGTLESTRFETGKDTQSFSIGGINRVGTFVLRAKKEGLISAEAQIKGKNLQIEVGELNLYGKIDMEEVVTLIANKIRSMEASEIKTGLLQGRVDNFDIKGLVKTKDIEFKGNLTIERSGNLLIDGSGTVYGSIDNYGNIVWKDGQIIGNALRTHEGSSFEGSKLLAQVHDSELSGKQTIAHFQINTDKDGRVLVKASGEINGEIFVVKGGGDFTSKGKINPSTKLFIDTSGNVVFTENSSTQSSDIEIKGHELVDLKGQTISNNLDISATRLIADHTSKIKTKSFVLKALDKSCLNGEFDSECSTIVASDLEVGGKFDSDELTLGQIDFENEHIKNLDLSKQEKKNLFFNTKLSELPITSMKTLSILNGANMNFGKGSNSDTPQLIEVDNMDVEKGSTLGVSNVGLKVKDLAKIDGALNVIGQLFLSGKKVSASGVISGTGRTVLEGDIIDITGKVSYEGGNFELKAKEKLSLSEASSLAASKIILHSDKEMELAGLIQASNGILVDFKQYDPKKIQGHLESEAWIAFNGDISNEQLYELANGKVDGKTGIIKGHEIQIQTTKPIVISKNIDVEHGLLITAPEVTLEHVEGNPEKGVSINSRGGSIGFKTFATNDKDSSNSITLRSGVSIKALDSIHLDSAGHVIREGEMLSGNRALVTSLESGKGGINISAAGVYQDIAALTKTTGKIVIKAQGGLIIVPLIYTTQTTRKIKHFLRTDTVTTTHYHHVNSEMQGGEGIVIESGSDSKDNVQNLSTKDQKVQFKKGEKESNFSDVNKIKEDYANSVTTTGGLLPSLGKLGQAIIDVPKNTCKAALNGDNILKATTRGCKDLTKAGIDVATEGVCTVLEPVSKDMEKFARGLDAGLKGYVENATTLKGAVSIAANAALIVCSGGASLTVQIALAAANGVVQAACSKEGLTWKNALTGASIGAVTCYAGSLTSGIKVANSALLSNVTKGIANSTFHNMSNQLLNQHRLNLKELGSAALSGGVTGAIAQGVKDVGGKLANSVLTDTSNTTANYLSHSVIYGERFEANNLAFMLGNGVAGSLGSYGMNSLVEKTGIQDLTSMKEKPKNEVLAESPSENDKSNSGNEEEKTPLEQKQKQEKRKEQLPSKTKKNNSPEKEKTNYVKDRKENKGSNTGIEAIDQTIDQFGKPVSKEERKNFETRQFHKKEAKEGNIEDTYAIDMLIPLGGPVESVGEKVAVDSAAIIGKGAKTLCFTGETTICIGSNSDIDNTHAFKPIEDIRVGDFVESCGNPENNICELKPVKEVFERKTNRLIVIKLLGQTIKTTPKHPFFIEYPTHNWVKAKNLQVGDLLKTVDGTLVPIEEMDEEYGDFKVYNLNVKNNHTYYVSGAGVLVHNCNKGIKWLEEKATRPLQKDALKLGKKIVNSQLMPIAVGGGSAAAGKQTYDNIKNDRPMLEGTGTAFTKGATIASTYAIGKGLTDSAVIGTALSGTVTFLMQRSDEISENKLPEITPEFVAKDISSHYGNDKTDTLVDLGVSLYNSIKNKDKDKESKNDKK